VGLSPGEKGKTLSRWTPSGVCQRFGGTVTFVRKRGEGAHHDFLRKRRKEKANSSLNTPKRKGRIYEIGISFQSMEERERDKDLFLRSPVLRYNLTLLLNGRVDPLNTEGRRSKEEPAVVSMDEKPSQKKNLVKKKKYGTSLSKGKGTVKEVESKG